MIRKPPALPKIEPESLPTEQRTVQLHDVDIRFPGQAYPLTLREKDSITEEDDRLLVKYADGRTITIYKRNLWFVAERDRTIAESVPVTLQARNALPNAPQNQPQQHDHATEPKANQQ